MTTRDEEAKKLFPGIDYDSFVRDPDRVTQALLLAFCGKHEDLGHASACMPTTFMVILGSLHMEVEWLSKEGVDLISMAREITGQPDDGVCKETARDDVKHHLSALHCMTLSLKEVREVCEDLEADMSTHVLSQCPCWACEALRLKMNKGAQA